MRDTRAVRATGLQGEPSLEIIEIIDDDTDTFGQRAPNLTTHDTDGPRWIGPVAAAALVGLIGYGVATSASSGGKPRAAAVTSTSEVTTTTERVPFTVPPPPVPYYAADPPAGYTVRYAEMQTQGAVDFGGGLYELWATPGATANSGSWFSIETSPGGGVFAQDAYRMMAGSRTVAVSHITGGQTLMQFIADGVVGVNITAFGWDDEQLARLAQSISTTGGSLTFTDDWFSGTHDLTTTIRPWIALQGMTSEIVSYAAVGDDPWFTLSVAPNSPPKPGELPADRRAALRFYLDRVTPFEIDGHSATAGALVGSGGQSLATWIDGDNIVSVQGAATTSQIIAFARTVRQVSSATWQDIRSQADVSTGSGDSGFGGSNPVPVASGTDADNGPWAIQVIVSTDRPAAQVVWQTDTGGWAEPAGDTAHIGTFADDHRTYVVADVPRTIAATAELHILRDGLDEFDVPFTDADPTSDRTFGGYAFSEPIPFTAQVVGPDGAVLATWPSP